MEEAQPTQLAREELADILQFGSDHQIVASSSPTESRGYYVELKKKDEVVWILISFTGRAFFGSVNCSPFWDEVKQVRVCVFLSVFSSQGSSFCVVRNHASTSVPVFENLKCSFRFQTTS